MPLPKFSCWKAEEAMGFALRIIFVLGLLNHSFAFADRGPLPTATANEVLEFLKKSGRDSTPEGRELVELVNFQQEFFGQSNISCLSYYWNDPKNESLFSKKDMVCSIESMMNGDKAWSKFTNPDAVQKLKDKKPFLKKTFGQESFGWAWVQFQLGEKQQSVDLLKRLFDMQCEDVMKITVMGHSFTSSPMDAPRRSARALDTLGVDGKDARHERLKKLETHLSKLPYQGALT